MTHTPSPTVIEEARTVLLELGAMEWLFCDGRANPTALATIIAAIELGERRAEAAVVGWLRDTNFGDDELDTTSLVFAGMIERGDHRSKP